MFGEHYAIIIRGQQFCDVTSVNWYLVCSVWAVFLKSFTYAFWIKFDCWILFNYICFSNYASESFWEINILTCKKIFFDKKAVFYFKGEDTSSAHYFPFTRVTITYSTSILWQGCAAGIKLVTAQWLFFVCFWMSSWIV